MESEDDHFTPEAVEETLRLAAAANAKIELDRAVNPRAGERVCLGVPHLSDAGWNFTESVLRVAAYDKAHGNHLLHNSGLMNNGALAAVWGRSMELAHARNTAAAAFLASDSDWLLWWDTDIGVEQDALEKLLSVADPETAPIVGGLCFIEGDYSHDFRGGLRSSLAPTLYDWAWIEPKSGMPGTYKMVARSEWAKDSVTRVGGTGCGFLLTHRSVYEKIAEWLRESGAPPHIWFERIPGADGELCGEDISFCLRAHQIGLPVLVHTGVTTTHQKTVWYGTPDYAMKPFTPPPANVRLLPPDQWPKLEINRNAARQAAETSPLRTSPKASLTPIDVQASLHSFDTEAGYTQFHKQLPMWKSPQDLERYRRIIEETKPEVVVETGTRWGGTAAWFADTFGVQVITVDIASVIPTGRLLPGVTTVVGSSVAPDVVAEVAGLVDGRRCMVTLDSDHHFGHVRAEIKAYAPMVSDGCYLVVEDALGDLAPASEARRFGARIPEEGGALPAIEAELIDQPGWVRALDIEGLSPVSHSPFGWWRRAV